MTPETQARALEEIAGVRLREDLVQLRLSGDDQREWLNGQVTNDVRQIGPGDGVYCLAVNVRGKIMADVWVVDEGEQLSLLAPATSQEALLESFEAQIIMEDVEVEPVPDARVISVQGPKAGAVLEAAAVQGHACDELGYGGRFVLASGAEAGAVRARLLEAAESLGGGAVEGPGFELARLRAVRAAFGADFDLRHYPQEAGLKQRAVSFNKGCYLGQEVVCTLENRGRLSRALMGLQADGELRPGAPLTDPEGKAVGEITSATRDPAGGKHIGLGYVKRAHAEVGTRLHSDGVEIELTGAAR